MERDPVCGMCVEPETAAAQTTQGGVVHFFCSTRCYEKFRKDPARYAEQVEPRERSGASTATLYTCPMHPEIRQPSPGTCPKCGMGLEPVKKSPPAARREYICPMHPEIVRDAPSSCPLCGMALEPRAVAIEEENPELVDMTRRFWVSGALALPVFILAMFADLAPEQTARVISLRLLQWVELVLATPVVLWGGWPCGPRRAGCRCISRRLL